MIPKNTVDEIFQTARIEEVIGDFVNLKKSGQNFKGLSPWANEKTPSFMVSPSKQIFKDFSSGKGGNVVSFLMEHEQMSFPEALKYLAKRYGIEVEEEALDADQEEHQKHREGLFKANDFALGFYETELWESDEGKAIGLSYFKERGFTDDTLKKFHLGYADQSFDSFFKQSVDRGYDKALLLELGLVKEKEGKSPYDSYRGRVIFPIHNVAGRCVGFGARILSKNTKAPKYINSPESEIYSKSNLLYGLYQSRSEIVKNDRCLLVEGYTDVISLHQSGIKNVVASSGTSLTEQQIRLIKRYSSNVTILFDGDAAGIKASFRGIDLLLKEGLNVKVLLFPEGEDPDSYSQSHSKEELQEFITDRSEDFVFFKARVLGKDQDNDPQKRSESIRDIVNSIALIPDHISRNIYLNECSKLLKISEQVLVLEVNKIRRKQLNQKAKKQDQRAPAPFPEEFIDPFDPSIEPIQVKFDAYYQEQDLLRLIIAYHDLEIEIDGASKLVPAVIAEDLKVDALSFDDEQNQTILNEVYKQLEVSQKLSLSYLINHTNEHIRSTTVNFLSNPYDLHKWDEKEIYVKDEKSKLKKAVVSSLFSFKARKVDLMIKNLQEQLSAPDLDDDNMRKILKKKSKLDNLRIQIGEKLGRVITY